jgi:hypothetical protein
MYLKKNAEHFFCDCYNDASAYYFLLFVMCTNVMQLIVLLLVVRPSIVT